MEQRLHTRITGQDIVRDRSEDFEDDGTRFEGYKYKGSIIITRAAGTGLDECFIAIHCPVPYSMLDEKDRELEEWFNGVPRDKYNRQILNAICEYFYQKFIEKNPNPIVDGLPEVE